MAARLIDTLTVAGAANRWRQARAELDEAIRDAHTAGVSLRQLAESTGLHRNTISDIVDRG